MHILFLPGSYTLPPARFRLWQFVEPLRALGHAVDVRVTRPPREWSSSLNPRLLRCAHNYIGAGSRVMNAFWLLRDAAQFDAIVMSRDVVPNLHVDFIEPWLARRNPRIVFDFDDAIHLGSLGRKWRKILPHFGWITPGNEFLASFAREIHKNVTILPTVVNTDNYQITERRKPGPIRIGWSGSHFTLTTCLPLLKDVICDLAQSEDFEFIVIANVAPQIHWPGVNIRFIPWTPQTEVLGLQQIDIGLMPLRDEPFERGKCGLKAIQYMAVGVPALVSPVGVNREIVVEGQVGFHCYTSDDWKRNIRLLLHDPDLRHKMGWAARERVDQHYSVRALLPRMLEVFDRVRTLN